MTDPETKSIFDIEPDDAEEALLDAEADIAAGHVVPHAKVAEWLNSWGTADERPCPTAKAP